MKTKLIALFSLLIVFGVFISSCDEQSLLPEPPNTQSAEDNANAEVGVANVFENVNNFGITEEGKKSLIIDGTEPEHYWNEARDTLYINFDGVDNSGGQIKAYFPGRPVQGINIEVTVTNFLNNGVTMNGLFTLELTVFNPIDSTLKPTFTITSNGDLSFTEDTVTTTWNGYRTIVWDEGFTLINNVPDDDVFLVSGISTGVNAEGVPYSVVINTENPLKLDDCEWISQGEITITEEAVEGGDSHVLILDFGDGTCDDEMTVTVDGVKIEGVKI